SGLGGLANTLADAAMTRLYREAAVATLDWLSDSGTAGAAVERVLEHLDNNTADYVDYLARMLGTRDQWLSIIGSGEGGANDRVRQALERAIAAQVNAQLARTRDAVASACGTELLALARYAGDRLSAGGGEAHALGRLETDRWPGTDADKLPQWQALAALLLTQSGSVRKRVNRNDGFPPGDQGQKSDFEGLLTALAAEPAAAAELGRVRILPSARYREEQWQVLVALFRLLPIAAGELQRLFAERGMSDHIEVALAASAALGSGDEPGDAALLLDYRIRHLLVDEMQDTSVGQYRLLEQLTAGWQPGDGRTLFCVGDPMQSIYRFRNAEVGQFLAARQYGLGHLPLESLLLRQNFRSGEHLVHWFNTVFSQILPADDDIAAGAIRYAESVPVTERLGEGRVAIHAVFGSAVLDEARRSAAVIRECLAEDPPGDVAVLVRSRTQLPQLLGELRAARIPYRAVDIDRLTDLPEIVDLLALTRAVCHRGDRIAWLGLLRGPWAGLDWSDIHRLVVNDATSSVYELAHDSERLAALSAAGRERLTAFMQDLLPHLRPPAGRSLRERIEAAWLALGGAAAVQDDDALANVYRYLDVLGSLETAGTLPDVAMLEQQLDDERVSSAGSADCRVQVMTMHKAKGLQFDHVVLHGLGRASGRHDKAVLDWINVAMPDGSSSMLISPLGPRFELEKDALHGYIEAISKDADRRELDRLLYVACTRARRSLQLVGHVALGGEQGDVRPPAAGTLLNRLWPALEREVTRQFAAAADKRTPPNDEATTNFVTPSLHRFAEPWSLPPLPRLPSPQLPASGAAVERAVEFEWVGSTARHAGTIVHRWLQKIANDRQPVTVPPADVASVSRGWARALGVASADMPELLSRVEQALGNVLADARGRWLLFGDGWSELKLTGLHGGRPESVVIDRVRIDGGVHWIVDYKTGTHEGGDLPRFLSQEAARYRPQLLRYAAIYGGLCDAPLRLALYFPLLRQFVEIETS
ncbi:MAG TPA: 3'-5' exonuclease, partial [Woeseiaceae bacterium]|nr:3'-5' exonuclease [Woeseiaceae bacterium]